MKKVLVGLVVLLVVAVIIAVVAGGPQGEPPKVAAALDAENTVGFVSYENVDQVAAKVVAALEQLPPSLRAQAPMFSAEAIKNHLGFDPAVASEWSAAGIDPSAGISMVVDARVFRRAGGAPEPMLVTKITDRDKLVTFASKFGVPVAFTAGKDGLAEMIVDKKTSWIGERGGYTFIIDGPILGDDAAKRTLRTQFTAFLAAAGPALVKDRAYRDAFAHAGGGGRLAGYGSSTALGGMLAGKLPVPTTDIKYYSDRFPTAAFALSDDGFSAQVVATADGVAALNKLFRAKTRSKLARFVPAKGWTVIRTAANIPQFFDGLAEFIPPSMAQMRMMLSMGKASTVMLGFSYDDLGKAFSGYAMGAIDLSSAMDAAEKGPSAVRWLAAAGVADEATADKVLDVLTGLAAKAGVRTPVEVAGNKGFTVGLDGLSVTIARIDDVILMAPSAAAIEQALKTAGGDSLAKTEAGQRVDDPDAFYVASVDLGGVMTRLEQGHGQLNPSDRQIITTVSKMDLWTQFRDRPFNISYILDGGVRLESSMAINPSSLVLLGVGMYLIAHDAAPPPELPTRAPVQQP